MLSNFEREAWQTIQTPNGGSFVNSAMPVHRSSQPNSVLQEEQVLSTAFRTGKSIFNTAIKIGGFLLSFALCLV